MTLMQCVWFTWPQPDLESVGILCKGHCLASIVPFGKDSFFFFGFQFLGKDKEMPLALLHSYTVERQGALFSLWESENVSQRPALSVQRAARIFPHSFLWLCFPEDVSSYFSESWKIPRGTILAWILCFPPLLWRKWWWRVDEWCWWYKKRRGI